MKTPLRKRLIRLWQRLKRRAYLANPLVDRGLRHYLLGRLFLEDVARRKKDVFFIQIGAHDGVTSDFLHDTVVNRDWRGVLVEPVRDLFELLVKNKSGLEGLIFENVAISDSDKNRTFYALHPEIKKSYPFWSDMLGSFDKRVVLKSKRDIPDIENYIIEQEVPCLTFSSLLHKHNVDHFDVLLIDVEGYDFEILKQVDLQTYKPKIIIFEHIHLSRQNRKNAVQMVKSAGYKVNRTDSDFIARLK